MFSSANMEIVFPGKPQFFPHQHQRESRVTWGLPSDCTLQAGLSLSSVFHHTDRPQPAFGFSPNIQASILTRSPPSACTIQVSSLPWLGTWLHFFFFFFFFGHQPRSHPRIPASPRLPVSIFMAIFLNILKCNSRFYLSLNYEKWYGIYVLSLLRWTDRRMGNG